MKQSRLCLLLLAVILAIGYVKAQSEDEFPIPIESYNQFPPDNQPETDGAIVEGSGAGIVEVLTYDITTELTTAPKLEEVESTAILHNEVISYTDSETPCPKPCVCSIEGEEFVVDCSGYSITEFPNHINPKTTKLNLQKNKLTEIPKQVSSLKNLKELNANDNLIMELAPGSVSELPELIVLKLANNRLIEYPKDLKNSLLLTKLQELDLGGNDMRTLLSPEIFMGFCSLRKVTLATSTPELVQDICAHLKSSLEAVCTGSCNSESFDCPEAPQHFEDDQLDAVVAGMIPYKIDGDEDKENADPSINIPSRTSSDKDTPTNKDSQISSRTDITTATDNKAPALNNFSLRNVVENAPADVASPNTIVNTPKKPTSTDGDVKIGAKTVDSKAGGVDRNIIAVIVAGMVLVVAVITIKKNWSSIKKRFSSTPRSPNERPGGNTNGTSPEEVPLQDKSPV